MNSAIFSRPADAACWSNVFSIGFGRRSGRDADATRRIPALLVSPRRLCALAATRRPRRHRGREPGRAGKGPPAAPKKFVYRRPLREGETEAEPWNSRRLATPQGLVFVAGAAFNILFAFALACILSVIGLPESSDSATTRIGYISKPSIFPMGQKSPAPRFRPACAWAMSFAPSTARPSAIGTSCQTRCCWAPVAATMANARDLHDRPQRRISRPSPFRRASPARRKFAGWAFLRLRTHRLQSSSKTPAETAALVKDDELLKVDGTPVLSLAGRHPHQKRRGSWFGGNDS